MFGLLKFLFYTFVAVVVGVVIGTVPFGGRTIADRIASAYQPATAAKVAAPARRVPPPVVSSKTAARAAPRAKPSAPAPVAAPTPAAGPVTAGAANSPDAHTDADKAALDRLIATRVKGK